MLMRLNPCSRNSATRSVPKRNSPRITLLRRAAALSASVASFSSGEVYMCGNSYFSYSPIDMHRSFCPRNRMSTPGTAAMSSMFLMQSAVSTCRAQMMLSLAGPA